MNKAVEYMQSAIELAKTVAETQESAIMAAAKAVADALQGGGTVYTFGTGHSHIMAEEIFYRAGGLVKVYPILDDPLMLHTAAARSSEMERLSGYAKLLIENNLGIKENDVMFIFSNSGRNTVSVDMAMCAKEKGMKTVCITNMNHTKSVTSRHPSGKLMYEVCDIVIDNCGCIGDAAIDIGGKMVGPTSTVIGAMVMQAIVCGAVEMLQQRGVEPEVFLSGNIDAGDAANEKYIKKYSGQIRIL